MVNHDLKVVINIRKVRYILGLLFLMSKLKSFRCLSLKFALISSKGTKLWSFRLNLVTPGSWGLYWNKDLLLMTIRFYGQRWIGNRSVNVVKCTEPWFTVPRFLRASSFFLILLLLGLSLSFGLCVMVSFPPRAGWSGLVWCRTICEFSVTRRRLLVTSSLSVMKWRAYGETFWCGLRCNILLEIGKRTYYGFKEKVMAKAKGQSFLELLLQKLFMGLDL